MSSQRQPLTAGRLAVLILGSPFFALYGIVVLMRSVLAFGRRGRALKLALGRTLICQNGHANETTGRWACAACGSVYHGWVGRCAVCNAPAGRIDCAICGVGLPLPWSRR